MLAKNLARYSKAGGLLVACLAAAAILITAYQPARPTDIAMPTALPEEAAAAVVLQAAAVEPAAATVAVARPEPPKAAAPAVKKAAPKKTTASKAPATRAAATKTVAANTTAAKAPVVEPSAKAPVVQSAAKGPAIESAAKAPVAASAANAPVQESDIVTLTGCLERDKRTYRLKDTAGSEAPKSRSWKSGFLKKGSATIDIVDAANRLKLTDHVGERVSVTGTLVDREMSARSLQRLGASCD